MLAAHIQNLYKEFTLDNTSNTVLHDICVDINMGQLTMLVGPSGCGKTTLISILSGILSLTKGSVTLLEQNLSKMSDTEKVLFRRHNIGFIFQQFNLLPALTAAENAAMPLIAAGVPFDEAVSKARLQLAKMDMKAHTEKLPRQLSGGQQQRVAIARAFVHNPRFIICDEPTSSLDEKTGQAIMEILRDIANDPNHAVLVVTHDNRIYHFANRIIEMNDGRIIGETTPSKLLHKD